MQKFYNKYRKIIEYIIYPISLLILPVMNYTQGVDVSDSTYSLGNYLFSDKLEGMWVMSTYLSNLFGRIIINLPGAATLRIANIYFGIILGSVGLLVYFALKNDFDARYVFLGEFIAICCCWIPKGILYNYLSYFIMAAGALALYKGIVKNSKILLFTAGVLLGLNVFVRIPNITQMALVVVLWLAYFVQRKNVFKDTLICIGGYLIGVGIPGVSLLIKYGTSGISGMISGLSSISSTDNTYSALSMISGPVKAYAMSSKWIALAVLVVLAGSLMFKILPGKLTGLKTAIYTALIVVMIRFFWGRGMFSFRYYEDYTSIYEWIVLVLIFSIAIDIYCIIRGISSRSRKDTFDSRTFSEFVMATISLVVIIIAPLGSNNNLYQNMNNMFLVLPFTVYIAFKIITGFWRKKQCNRIPVAVMIYAVMLCVLIQAFGFSQNFVFRDGMRGEPRDTMISGVESLEGMYTNADNAGTIMGLCEFMQKQTYDSIILLGDCPGLTYILKKPSALFSSWIDLDSNSAVQIKKELEILRVSGKNIPVIIRNKEVTAVAFEQKRSLISDYIAEGGYSLAYENSQYKVYMR